MDLFTLKNDNDNQERTFCSYEALQFLIRDENEIMSILQGSYNNIILVPFKINTDGSEPFNTFMLLNDVIQNRLVFPQLDIENLSIKILNDYTLFMSIIKCYLFSLNFSNSYENFDKNYNFKGIYLYNNSIYIFIDLTKVEMSINLIYRDTLYWFALLDEIVNKKHVCNIDVEKEVTTFFLNNNVFLYLKNSRNEQIEIPTVVYSGTHEKLLNFTYFFGKSKDDSNSILGANYYFTDFKNAIRYGGWSKNNQREFRHGVEITENDEGKYKKGGIIRYAIFLGNCLIKENMPNDKIDESDIKKDKLNNYYEKMTLRISDYDSSWSSVYDSVFLGDIELDDGQILKDSPIFVIKEFENQVPLTYHIINKNLLKDTFCKNEIYEIL